MINFFSNVPLQEKINFARNLSVGIKSGIPITQILGLLEQQTSSKNFSVIIRALITHINSGQFLAQALTKYKNIFGDFFINIVQVGESSGNLSSSLLYLAAELKKQRDIAHRVKSALIYPIILFFVTIGITVFLTVFIFPKILPVFSSLKIELPFTTKTIIWLLAVFKQYGVAILGLFTVFIIGLKLFLRIKQVRYFFHKIMLSTPFISKILINLTLANFSRSLGVLLKSGMTIVDALTVAKGTFGNTYYKKQIDYLIESIKRGETISRFLEKNPKLFPLMFSGMIKIGESTGNLEENLTYLAEYYEAEVDEVLKDLTAVVEPIMLLFMGLMVGFIALSIITPIYKVTEGVNLR